MSGQNNNQYPFEVLRDLATIMSQLRHDHSVTVKITRTSNDLFDWTSDFWNMPSGPSEASRGMREAYEKIYGDWEGVGARCELP